MWLRCPRAAVRSWNYKLKPSKWFLFLVSNEFSNGLLYRYYCIEELVEHTDKAVKNMKRDTMLEVEPRCRVPLITSLKEEQALIQANASKPLIKLLINRHNNKYSYTGASDENLLKNIELFDKLSLRFSNRVLFIKDVIGSNEICCWSFYGHGKRIAEVCCTAIVYATDRKNTKVRRSIFNCPLLKNISRYPLFCSGWISGS